MAGPWFYNSNATGTGDGLSWVNARVTLATMTSVVAGDQIWVSNNHNESTAGSVTITFPGTLANPNIVVCADDTVASPGPGDWKTTGAVSTSGTANYISLVGSAYIYGLTFTASTNASITCSTAANGWQRYDSCVLSAQGATGTLALAKGAGSKLELINTSVKFNNAGGGISNGATTAHSEIIWRNSTALAAGSTVPTSLLISLPGVLRCDGVDFNGMTSGTISAAATPGSQHIFNDCRFNAGSTVATTPTNRSTRIIVNNSDATGTNYRFEQYTYTATETTETTIIRTGGASDGTTGVSRRLTTTANVSFVSNYESLPIDKWNTTTGSAATAIVRGIWNAAVLPTNAQIWTEAQFLGNASYPLASFTTNSKLNNSSVAADVTADTSAWDSQVAARQNNHVYNTLGATIKTASAPGQVWFCTQTGTSAGSEPAGYTGAADGTEVTDNTAKFRAGVRFSLSLTLTSPQLKGSFFLYAKVGAASSTFWIDPLITAS